MEWEEVVPGCAQSSTNSWPTLPAILHDVPLPPSRPEARPGPEEALGRGFGSCFGHCSPERARAPILRPFHSLPGLTWSGAETHVWVTSLSAPSLSCLPLHSFCFSTLQVLNSACEANCILMSHQGLLSSPGFEDSSLI